MILPLHSSMAHYRAITSDYQHRSIPQGRLTTQYNVIQKGDLQYVEASTSLDVKGAWLYNSFGSIYDSSPIGTHIDVKV